MVAIDRYTKSGAIAMTVAVAALFHATEGSLFSLSLSLAQSLAVQSTLHYHVELFSLPPPSPSFFSLYNLAEIGSIINFRTQHCTKKASTYTYVCATPIINS